MNNEINSKPLLDPTPIRPRRFNPLLLAALLLVAVGALLPLWLTEQPFVIVLFSHAFIAAMLAVTLHMLTGNTGLLSFGHAGWFGLRAYLAGLLARNVSADLLLVLAITAVATLVLALG